MIDIDLTDDLSFYNTAIRALTHLREERWRIFLDIANHPLTNIDIIRFLFINQVSILNYTRTYVLSPNTLVNT